jgi:hypothetical protein
MYSMSESLVGYAFSTAHVVRPVYWLLQIAEVVGKDGSGVVVVGASVVVGAGVVGGGSIPNMPYEPKHCAPGGGLAAAQPDSMLLCVAIREHVQTATHVS